MKRIFITILNDNKYQMNQMNRYYSLTEELIEMIEEKVYCIYQEEHSIKMKSVFEVFNSDEYGKWEDYVKEEMENSERTLEECYTDFSWSHGGYTYGQWRFLNLHESGVVMDCYDSPE